MGGNRANLSDTTTETDNGLVQWLNQPGVVGNWPRARRRGPPSRTVPGSSTKDRWIRSSGQHLAQWPICRCENVGSRPTTWPVLRLIAVTDHTWTAAWLNAPVRTVDASSPRSFRA